MSNTDTSSSSSSNNASTFVGIQRKTVAEIPTALDNFLEMLKSQKLCDVVFFVGKEKVEIKCHKFVLVARSPYFETKYSERWKEQSEQPSGQMIEEYVLDQNPKAFKGFIEFLYGDKLSDDVSDVMEILPLADFYGVDLLLKKCQERLKKAARTLEYAFKVFMIAVKFNWGLIQKRAERFIASNILELSNHSSFGYADEPALTCILQRNDLSVSEVQLFQILLNWAKIRRQTNPVDRRRCDRTILKNLIAFVRFPTMTSSEFSAVVHPTNILTHEEMSNLYQYFILDFDARKKIFHKIRFPTAFRGSESTIDFYQTKPTKTNFDPGSVAPETSSEVQFDILSFTLQVPKPLPANQQLVITTLYLRGPTLQDFIEEESRTGVNEPNRRKYDVLISIEKYEDNKFQRKVSERITLSAGENVAYVVKPIDRFPLGKNKSFSIFVQFSSEVPFFKKRQNSYLATVDLGCDASLQSNICKTGVAQFDLKDIKITAYTWNSKVDKPLVRTAEDICAFHVVRSMKLEVV